MVDGCDCPTQITFRGYSLSQLIAWPRSLLVGLLVLAVTLLLSAEYASCTLFANSFFPSDTASAEPFLVSG